MLLAQPIDKQLGASGTGIVDRARRLLAWSAAALLVAELLTLAAQGAVLVGTLNLPAVQAVTTTFAAAVATISAGAVAIAVGAVWAGESVRGYVLVPAALLILGA